MNPRRRRRSAGHHMRAREVHAARSATFILPVVVFVVLFRLVVNVSVPACDTAAELAAMWSTPTPLGLNLIQYLQLIGGLLSLQAAMDWNRIRAARGRWEVEWVVVGVLTAIVLGYLQHRFAVIADMAAG